MGIVYHFCHMLLSSLRRSLCYFLIYWNIRFVKVTDESTFFNPVLRSPIDNGAAGILLFFRALRWGSFWVRLIESELPLFTHPWRDLNWGFLTRNIVRFYIGSCLWSPMWVDGPAVPSRSIFLYLWCTRLELVGASFFSSMPFLISTLQLSSNWLMHVLTFDTPHKYPRKSFLSI